MRVGIYFQHVDEAGRLLDGPGMAKRAQMIEAAGLDSIWIGDHTPIPGDTDRDNPDPLMVLLTAALATSPAIELGTCIYCLPLRNKYEAAQRFFTLEMLAPGRFTLGVGTGSQQVEYEANGLDWDDRFRRLSDHMEGVREIFEGKPVGPLYRQHPALDKLTGIKKPVVIDPNEDLGPPIAVQTGRPRFGLGAWHSEKQLKRAASEYDCWLASASPGAQFGGWKKVFTESIKMYRDFGGARAIACTVAVNFRETEAPFPDTGVFHLRCSPNEAADRLGMLADLGFDDVLVNFTDPVLQATRIGQAKRYDPTVEDYETLRSILPKDTTDYHLA